MILDVILALCLAQGSPVPVQNLSGSGQEPTGRTDAVDPFRPQGALRDVLESLRGEPDRSSGFRPTNDESPLPSMHMRGYVKLRSRAAPAAVVEVDTVGYFTVHQDEEIAFTVAAPQRTARAPVFGARVALAGSEAAMLGGHVPVALRVERVLPSGVIVEVGTLGEFFVIR